MPTNKHQPDVASRIPDDILAQLKAIASKQYTPDEIAELEASTSSAGQDPAMYAAARTASEEYNDFDIGPDGKIYARR